MELVQSGYMKHLHFKALISSPYHLNLLLFLLDGNAYDLLPIIASVCDLNLHCLLFCTVYYFDFNSVEVIVC